MSIIVEMMMVTHSGGGGVGDGDGEISVVSRLMKY